MPNKERKVVPASQVSTEAIVCPACGGNNLVLEGYAQKRYAVEVYNGVIVNEVLDDDEWRHDVRVITCKRCHTITEIVSDDLWNAWQTIQAGVKSC